MGFGGSSFGKGFGGFTFERAEEIFKDFFNTEGGMGGGMGGMGFFDDDDDMFAGG